MQCAAFGGLATLDEVDAAQYLAEFKGLSELH